MMELLKDVGLLAVTGLIAVVAWFLREKDARQQKDMDLIRDNLQKQVTLLFLKHDEDAQKLSDLKESIARDHYVKAELDNRFQRLEDAFRTGFNDLGTKIDNLSRAMMDNFSKDR